MAEQHRATAEQWRDVKALADDIVTYSCILELRDRIEALEAAATAQPNHPETDSSLVHRVARAMNGATEWQARAAIREVAAWLREHYGGLTATTGLLEHEAEL